MIWRILLSVALALAPGVSHAECECLWQGSFDDVQAETDLVVAAEVIAIKGNSIDLDALQLLRGTLPPVELRVWLEYEEYCRPELGTFPLGSRWVMALDKIESKVSGGFNPNTPNYSYGRIDDYAISNCGGYWLKWEGDAVTGNLVDAPRWDHEPKMTPVLLELIAAYVAGDVSSDALLAASREDPALRELRLNTRAFLRGDEE
ncbi:delta-aminolevulinic acid dehydratase [Halioglobus maricola]|uniref:Delta-aminolevulinic acid dehydratase n=1 Tax=Halioglobus maricola TaxID=2601894 RepID=A0A5P9NFF7_9GAMM|nr:delta-aminolevulinic acid dehydratase [Halioglobus maricola]QFU74511.1 delta-aminolevulinic acid dehydratase [Halioglobus maricola]